MNWQMLLAQYLCVVVVITLHEFGHAWMSSRCGDDTARLLGRVSLNPIVHMDPIGTVALPLLTMILTLSGYSQVAGFIIGWGKPVPVNHSNLRRVDQDSVLIAMAGPAMNLVLTVIVMLIVKLATMGDLAPVGEAGIMMAQISMVLFFFNLIPVPPLDGSHLLRYITRMSWELFAHISRFGFLIVIILVQLQPVKAYITVSTAYTIVTLANALRIWS